MSLSNDIPDCLETLKSVEVNTGWELLTAITNEGHGTVKEPDFNNNWDTQQFEIALYGATAEGSTKAETILRWSKVARRLSKGFMAYEDAKATLLGEAGTVLIEDMIDACETIMTTVRLRGDDPTNHMLYQAATQLRRKLVLPSSEAA